MPQYIRAVVPGGTFFFTVTLLERCGKLMMLKAGCASLSRPTGLIMRTIYFSRDFFGVLALTKLMRLVILEIILFFLILKFVGEFF
jgi:hypothetical protein